MINLIRIEGDILGIDIIEKVLCFMLQYFDVSKATIAEIEQGRRAE